MKEMKKNLSGILVWAAILSTGAYFFVPCCLSEMERSDEAVRRLNDYEASAQRSDIFAVVGSVRITTETKSESGETASPTTRAIVGGIVGGTPGAIVGAATTENRPGVVEFKNKFLGCRLIVRLDSGELITFTSLTEYWGRDSAACTTISLLRPGDSVKIKCVKYPDQTKYVWNNIYGEVSPG